MALVLADRVQDVTTTTGTGTLTLANTPPTGFQSFAAIGDGNTTYYSIYGGNDWEVGIGTYNSTGFTLTRDTVLASSNNGSLVNFGAGEKAVFVTYPAEKSVNKDAAGNININITGNAATATKATNLNDGSAGAIPYQSASNVTTFLSSAAGVLVGGNPPTFSTAPTLTGTNFTGIPNGALSNNSVTIGSTSVSLGATATTLAGLTSVTLTQDPTLALQAATKQYVDTLAAEGVSYHAPVKYEAPNALTATYNNGTAGVGATLTNAGTQTAFTPDGVVAQVGDRILIYQQADATQNGVYTVTTVGSGSTNWVLTRATDANSYGVKDPNKLGAGDAFFVTSGDTGAGETYVMNTTGTITFGTTAINFVQVSAAQVYSAGTGLTLTGTQFSLTSPVATTLGGTGLTTFGAANRAIYSSGTTTLTAGTLPTAAGGTGHTTYTDGQILIGKSSDGSLEKANLTAGTSISITNGSGAITITNTAPDQVVSITGSGTTTVTGTYPSFNISSADQYVGTVTSVSATTDTTGTDVAVAVTNATTTPAIAISIPSASASARGALTSSDWSTFNAKQSALVSGTNIKTINGSSILGSGDLSTLTSPLALVAGSGAGAEIRLPEATANGTNYVALKSPDTLAADYTLTLPTADGTSGQVLQTNGSGQLSFATASSGTQQFTSSGSITAGQAVSINSNGTVSTTTGVSQDATFTPTNLYASNSYVGAGLYDAASGWHFQVSWDSSGNRWLYTFKVSSAGVITNTNATYIGNNGSVNDSRAAIAKDTTANRFAVMFAPGGGYQAVQVYYFSLNTTTGATSNAGSTTLGSAMYNAFAFDMYYDSYANRMVAIYNYTNGGLYANAINYNSGSPTTTASQTFTMYNNNQATCCAAFNSTTNAGRVFYSDPSNNYMATRTITLSADGATMTLGSQTIPYSGNFTYYTRAYYFPSINRFIVQFAPYSSPYSYMFDGSGNQVTGDSSSPSSAGQNWGSYGFYSSPDTTNNVIYIVGSTSSVLAVWSITLTASTMTYNGGTSLNSSSYSYVGTGITYDPTNQRGAIGARGSGSNAQLIGFLPQVFSSNADKFVGFATQSVATGQPVTVTVLGGVNTNQTGLTTSTAYYLRYDGTLVTTTTPYGIVARALSATSLQVTPGGAFMKLVSQTTISGNPASVTVSLPTGYQQVQIIFNGLQVRTGGQYIIITGVTSSGSSIGFYGHGISANSTNNATGFATSGSLYPTPPTASDYASFNGYLTINTASSSAPAFTSAFNTSSTASGANATLITGYVSSYPASLTISPGGGSTYWGTGTISVYGIG